MQDELFDGVDWRMVFGVGVDVVSVEVDSVAICPVMPSIHPIRVDNGYNIEHKLLPEQPRNIRILQQPLQHPIHHMAAGHLPGMHPRTQEYSLFIICEALGPMLLRKENLILDMLLLFGDLPSRADRYQLHRTILVRVDKGGPVEVNVG